MNIGATGAHAPGGPSTLARSGHERLARRLEGLLREPAGLVELGLARLVRRLQLVHAGVDLLSLALTRLALLLSQRGEARVELGLLLGERLVDAID